MKKALILLLALSLLIIPGCGKKDDAEGVMSHEEYVAAEVDAEVYSLE